MFCLILILIHFQVETILYQVKSLKQKIVNLERHCFISCLIVNFFYCHKYYANPTRRDEC
jgi:hypothetical protein